MSDEVICISVVASGQGHSSYPIEVGWCGLDLVPDSFLVRPADDWSDLGWSSDSQLFHQLTLERCARDGVDLRKAARRLNGTVASKAILSGAPYLDEYLLRTLFEAADVAPRFPMRPRDLRREITERRDREPCGWGLWEMEVRLLEMEHVARTHRAAGDARYLAALWRCAHEDGFLETLEGGAL